MKKVINDSDLDNVTGGTKNPPLLDNVAENIEIFDPQDLEELTSVNSVFNDQDSITDIILNSASITRNACKVYPTTRNACRVYPRPNKKPARRKIDE